MSSTQDSRECPKCNGCMVTYYQNRPLDFVSGECVDCGFSYWTEYSFMELAEVNEVREERGLKPIKKLKKVSNR